MVQEKSFSYCVFTVFNYVFLGLLGISCLLPIVHILAISLSSPFAVEARRVALLPVEFTIESYKTIFSLPTFYYGFFNSALRVVVGTLVNMFLTCITAYPLSREPEELKGRNIIIWFMIFPMLFGGGLIPTYLLIRELGLIDNFWVLILPGAIPLFNAIMMMNFFRGLPRGLYEAAMIDGAGHWRILVNVYVPLSLPSIATLTLFCIVGHWNAWFDALIYLKDPASWPIQTVLKGLLSATNLNNYMDMRKETTVLNQETLTTTFIILVTLPILLLYPFLQKYFVKGIVVGSIKE